ncbi:MAG: Ldh family oxidoreductase [Halofilum sp. (in: g-proteobacteria)]|nr:Ldh family oxidoreductase [Halofilum sp. (in: g-proteobacteria)]
MKVSHNELTGLCRRAFEGLGFPSGEHEDAADMVVWLEQHGLHGVEALRRGMDRLADGAPAKLAKQFEDSSVAVIDGGGNSALLMGSLAVDLVYAKARRKGLAVVKIQDCHDRRLMLGYLARCARRGMNLLAFWRNSEDPVVVEQVVSMRAWEEFPTLLLYQIDDRDDNLRRNRSVTLVASPHFSMLQSLHPDPEEATLLEALGPADFEGKSRKVWESGLEVDDDVWARLKGLAARTLVAASESSRRRGAGEGAP